MGWSNQVIQASEVVIGGAPDALFVYNGNPGPGDLIAWIVSQVGVIDPYSNAVPGPVIGTRNPATGASARLNGSSLVLSADGGGVTAPGGVSQTPAGVVDISSGGTSLADAQSTLFIFSKNAGGLGAPGASLDVQMGLYGSSPTGGPQSWQPMTLINGWVNNASFGIAGFRPLGSPPNSLEVTGAIAGNAATGAVFWQIPAIYGTPLTPGGRACGTNGGNAGATTVANIRWDAAGNLSVANSAALPVAATFLFGFTLPLDTL
jgi:hypothetical protein